MPKSRALTAPKELAQAVRERIAVDSPMDRDEKRKLRKLEKSLREKAKRLQLDSPDTGTDEEEDSEKRKEEAEPKKGGKTGVMWDDKKPSEKTGGGSSPVEAAKVPESEPAAENKPPHVQGRLSKLLSWIGLGGNTAEDKPDPKKDSPVKSPRKTSVTPRKSLPVAENPFLADIKDLRKKIQAILKHRKRDRVLEECLEDLDEIPPAKQAEVLQKVLKKLEDEEDHFTPEDRKEEEEEKAKTAPKSGQTEKDRKKKDKSGLKDNGLSRQGKDLLNKTKNKVNRIHDNYRADDSSLNSDVESIFGEEASTDDESQRSRSSESSSSDSELGDYGRRGDHRSRRGGYCGDDCSRSRGHSHHSRRGRSGRRSATSSRSASSSSSRSNWCKSMKSAFSKGCQQEKEHKTREGDQKDLMWRERSCPNLSHTCGGGYVRAQEERRMLLMAPMALDVVVSSVSRPGSCRCVDDCHHTCRPDHSHEHRKHHRHRSHRSRPTRPRRRPKSKKKVLRPASLDEATQWRLRDLLREHDQRDKNVGVSEEEETSEISVAFDEPSPEVKHKIRDSGSLDEDTLKRMSEILQEARENYSDGQSSRCSSSSICCTRSCSCRGCCSSSSSSSSSSRERPLRRVKKTVTKVVRKKVPRKVVRLPEPIEDSESSSSTSSSSSSSDSELCPVGAFFKKRFRGCRTPKCSTSRSNSKGSANKSCCTKSSKTREACCHTPKCSTSRSHSKKPASKSCCTKSPKTREACCHTPKCSTSRSHSKRPASKSCCTKSPKTREACCRTCKCSTCCRGGGRRRHHFRRSELQELARFIRGQNVNGVQPFSSSAKDLRLNNQLVCRCPLHGIGDGGIQQPTAHCQCYQSQSSLNRLPVQWQLRDRQPAQSQSMASLPTNAYVTVELGPLPGPDIASTSSLQSPVLAGKEPSQKQTSHREEEEEEEGEEEEVKRNVSTCPTCNRSSRHGCRCGLLPSASSHRKVSLPKSAGHFANWFKTSVEAQESEEGEGSERVEAEVGEEEERVMVLWKRSQPIRQKSHHHGHHHHRHHHSHHRHHSRDQSCGSRNRQGHHSREHQQKTKSLSNQVDRLLGRKEDRKE